MPVFFYLSLPAGRDHVLGIDDLPRYHHDPAVRDCDRGEYIVSKTLLEQGA